ncbi:M20/M25/M40 family metallo-hydrolase, partial [Rikenella microfusus]
MDNGIFEAAQRLAAQVTQWRREIHRNAELSFEEHRTSALIRRVLDQYDIPYEEVAGTGVLARIDGRTADARHPVVLRADMDALPIAEATGLPFACTNGAMHACGHDMHTAALLGALVLLNERRERFEGTV